MKQNYKRLSYQSEIDIITLNAEKIIEFNVIFNQEDLFHISSELELESIKKASLYGKISKLENDKWALTAAIGATILQRSVLTLKPVTTRIDEKITRQLIKGPDLTIQKNELELNDDDFIEQKLRLGNVFFECLALAIPTYPKAKNEIFDNISIAEKDQKNPSAQMTSPFAILSTLKKHNK